VAALKTNPGTWKEAFGSRLAEESFTAYYLSTYINEIAKAGKQIYPLVTYVNAWNGGEDTGDQFELFDRPGESYPSGGPVSHMLDLWKATAPDIDILCSDTSVQPFGNFRLITTRYFRPDNPYWSPEAGRTMSGARAFFYALAQFSAIGFGAYGVDSGTGPELESRFLDQGADYRLVKATMPAVTDMQAEGKLKAAIEEEGVRAKNLIFDRYHFLVRYIPVPATPAQPSIPSARVLVGELGPDEYLIMGFNATADIRPTVGSGFTAAQSSGSRKEFMRTPSGKRPTWAELTRETTLPPASRFRPKVHLSSETDALLDFRAKGSTARLNRKHEIRKKIPKQLRVAPWILNRVSASPTKPVLAPAVRPTLLGPAKRVMP